MQRTELICFSLTCFECAFFFVEMKSDVCHFQQFKPSTKSSRGPGRNAAAILDDCGKNKRLVDSNCTTFYGHV